MCFKFKQFALHVADDVMSRVYRVYKSCRVQCVWLFFRCCVRDSSPTIVRTHRPNNFLFTFFFHHCGDAGRFLYLPLKNKKIFLIVSLSAIFFTIIIRRVLCVRVHSPPGHFHKRILFHFILFFSFLFSSPLRYLITRWNFKNTKPHVNL